MRIENFEVSDVLDKFGEVDLRLIFDGDSGALDAADALKLTEHLERVFNLSGAKQCNDNK